jgi:hypothetical protein
MSPVGLGIKNDCAGDDQQQFTLPTMSHSPSPNLCGCIYPREREIAARVIPEKTGRSPQKLSTEYKQLKEE